MHARGNGDKTPCGMPSAATCRWLDQMVHKMAAGQDRHRTDGTGRTGTATWAREQGTATRGKGGRRRGGEGKAVAVL